jgi:two-component sensor histidine kinase
VTIDERPLLRRLSLRVLLLLIFAVALSPVLVIGGIRWSGDIEREAQYRRETMKLVAQLAAERAQRALESAPSALELIAATIEGDPCKAPLKRVVDALPDFGAFGVVDANGAVVCSTLEGSEGVNVAKRPWFIELRETGAAFVQSSPLMALVAEDMTIASAARRETATGTFAGALVLGTPVKTLVAQLDHSNLPRGYEVALVDIDGQVFGSTHWDRIDPAVMARLAAGEIGAFPAQAQASDKREAVIIPLTGNAFYAMVSAPPPPPIAVENVSAFGNFALPLLAWLLALVTAWLAIDHLVLRWLDYLRRIATLYASGKLTVQPLRAKKKAPFEINALADTLEEMAIRIRDRTDRMETALQARDAAMKEIHHRVKNNLQIINSLLSLQGRKLHDKVAIAVLDDARARINALSLIHRSLYEHNDITTVQTQSLLTDLVSYLDQALGAEDLGITIAAAIDDDRLDADMAVPLALFTAEAVTNSVKHAFPTSAGGSVSGSTAWRVCVSYNVHGNEAILAVADNGVDLEQRTLEKSSGIGGTLMAAFAKQVRGKLEERLLPEGGRVIQIRMPRLSALRPSVDADAAPVDAA